MKAAELLARLQNLKATRHRVFDDLEVCLEVPNPHDAHGIFYERIIGVYEGIDWDAELLFLIPESMAKPKARGEV